MALPEPDYLAPQITLEWRARHRAGGYSLILEVGRLFRVCRVMCTINVPGMLHEGDTGKAYLRFYLDTSQADPQTGRHEAPTGSRPR